MILSVFLWRDSLKAEEKYSEGQQIRAAAGTDVFLDEVLIHGRKACLPSVCHRAAVQKRLSGLLPDVEGGFHSASVDHIGVLHLGHEREESLKAGSVPDVSRNLCFPAKGLKG